jgi:transposase
VTAIVVHDHSKPHYIMPGVYHAMCDAHHLRELQTLIDIEKKDWRAKMPGCSAAHATRPAHVRFEYRRLLS